MEWIKQYHCHSVTLCDTMLRRLFLSNLVRGKLRNKMPKAADESLFPSQHKDLTLLSQYIYLTLYHSIIQWRRSKEPYLTSGNSWKCQPQKPKVLQHPRQNGATLPDLQPRSAAGSGFS